MGGIHDQSDGMLTAKRQHRPAVHRTVDALAVLRRQILLARLRTIIIRRAALVEHLHRPAAFRRSSEYQYHDAVSSP
jgi:hypothetical protein